MLGAQNVTEGDLVLMKNFLELSDASRQEVIAFVRPNGKKIVPPDRREL